MDAGFRRVVESGRSLPLDPPLARPRRRPPMIRSLPIGSLLVVASLSILGPAPAGATGKVMLYVERMEPYGQDAENFSRAAWGGGLGGVAPVPFAHELLAGVRGLERTNFVSGTVPYYAQATELRMERQTHQSSARFHLCRPVS